MARYDERWPARPAGWQALRYDHFFATRAPGRAVGRRGEQAWGEADLAYDREYRDARRNFGEPVAFDPRSDSGSGNLYGPMRYGLGPYYHRLLERQRPDDELKEEVEEALFYDSWVDAEAISVEVSNGVVTLKGELPSFEEIRYAVDDAWDVDGVRGVQSLLSLRDKPGRAR